MQLDDAAIACGIPLEEAQLRAQKRLQNGDATNYQMRVAGQAAIAKAVETLTKIADEPPRERLEKLSRALDEATERENGRTHMSERIKVSLYNTDLDAAKALAKIGVDLVKLSGVGPDRSKEGSGAKLSVQLDLWDNPGNWNLKKPE